MAIVAKENLCAGCVHAVINGVACDWPAQFCPQAERLNRKRSRPSAYALNKIGMLDAQGEFDVIRSNN